MTWGIQDQKWLVAIYFPAVSVSEQIFSTMKSVLSNAVFLYCLLDFLIKTK